MRRVTERTSVDGVPLSKRSGVWYADFRRWVHLIGGDGRVSLRVSDLDVAKHLVCERMKDLAKAEVRRMAGASLHGTPIGALRLMLRRIEDASLQQDLVYVLWNPQAGLVKIGHSRDLLGRLRSIQTSSPISLELILLLPGGREAEYRIHRRFLLSRVKGEWFTPTVELLDWVEEQRRTEAAIWEALRPSIARFDGGEPVAP